jgi:hypothetical protein
MLPAVLASLFMTVAQQLPTVNPPKNGKLDRAPLKVKPRAKTDVTYRAALSRAEGAVAGGSFAVGGEDAVALGRNEVLDDRLPDGGGQLGEAGGASIWLWMKKRTSCCCCSSLLINFSGERQDIRPQCRPRAATRQSAAATATYGRPA